METVAQLWRRAVPVVVLPRPGDWVCAWGVVTGPGLPAGRCGRFWAGPGALCGRSGLRGLVRRPCPGPGSGGQGRDGGLGGALLAGAAPPGADGLEQVVAGGPQGEVEGDPLLAVAEGGAAAGGQPGGDPAPGSRAPPAEGPRLWGVPPRAPPSP